MRADEIELLAEVCRQLDLADNLREAATGTLGADGRVHPALVELRLVRMELRRTLAQLALPDEVVDGEPRPEVPRFRSARARRVANARWSRESG